MCIFSTNREQHFLHLNSINVNISCHITLEHWTINNIKNKLLFGMEENVRTFAQHPFFWLTISYERHDFFFIRFTFFNTEKYYNTTEFNLNNDTSMWHFIDFFFYNLKILWYKKFSETKQKWNNFYDFFAPERCQNSVNVCVLKWWKKHLRKKNPLILPSSNVNNNNNEQQQ